MIQTKNDYDLGVMNGAMGVILGAERDGAMTLDWLGRHEEAGRLFGKVGEMDPNNHYVAMLRGWHAIQVQDWADARRWLERSISIKPYSNWLAHNYLKVVNERLAEAPATAVGTP
mgnify:CR=1 FL=1